MTGRKNRAEDTGALDLAPASPAAPPAPVSGRPEDVMAAVISAAMTQGIDADKAERMFALYERMQAHHAKVQFHEALARMLPRIPEIVKTGIAADSTGRRLYSFAEWHEMNRIIKPILAEHGFALTFRTEDHERGVLVIGILSRGGHSETSSLLLSLDSASRAMNGNQARGNAVSYGKRYTAAALLNLITVDEQDNDAACPLGTLTEQQAARVRDLLGQLGRSEEQFLAWANAQGWLGTEIESLPASAYQRIEAQLSAWLAKRRRSGGNG